MSHAFTGFYHEGAAMARDNAQDALGAAYMSYMTFRALSSSGNPGEALDHLGGYLGE